MVWLILLAVRMSALFSGLPADWMNIFDPNVEVGRRQSGQPLLSARSGLAVRAQPLVGNLDLFSSKPKTNSASSRHHILHRRPRHDKRCFRCLNLRGRLAARSRAAVAARLRPILFVSNVSGEGTASRPRGAVPSSALFAAVCSLSR